MSAQNIHILQIVRVRKQHNMRLGAYLSGGFTTRPWAWQGGARLQSPLVFIGDPGKLLSKPQLTHLRNGDNETCSTWKSSDENEASGETPSRMEERPEPSRDMATPLHDIA